MFGRAVFFWLIVVAALPRLSFAGHAHFFGDLPCDGQIVGKGRALPSEIFLPLDENPLPEAGLVTTLTYEGTYEPNVIRGTVPARLKGRLYRNGPGLFDRNGARKRVPDGDGKPQVFAFDNGRVTYTTRFIATKKFVQEEAAGRFLFDTWSTIAPGRSRFSLGFNFPSQANITIVRRGELTYGLDESQRPMLLDPKNLHTAGEVVLNPVFPNDRYQAHTKVAGVNGEWVLFGLEQGRKLHAVVTVLDYKNHITSRRKIPLPRRVYMHDWAVTPNYFVFLLHPVFTPLRELAKVALGRQAIIDSIQWRPEAGNQVLVVPRDADSKPVLLDGPPRWIWHVVNSYEKQGRIIVDYIGSENPSIFTSEDSMMFRLMKGESSPPPTAPSNFIRRYVLDPRAEKLHEMILLDDADYELPTVSANQACQEHTFCYAMRWTSGPEGETSIVRLNTETGKREVHRMGKHRFCSEPIYIPDPNDPYIETAGWVATQIYDANTKKSSLLLISAKDFEGEPIAELELNHHVPMGFHGTFVAE